MFKRILAGLLLAAGALGLVAVGSGTAEATNGRNVVAARKVVVVQAQNRNVGVRFGFNQHHRVVAVPVAVAPVSFAAPSYSFAAPSACYQQAAPQYQAAAPCYQAPTVQPITQFAYPAAQPLALPVQTYQAPVCAAPVAAAAPVCAAPMASYSYAAPVVAAAPVYSYGYAANHQVAFAAVNNHHHRVAFAAANNHRVAVQRVVVVQQRRVGLFNRDRGNNNQRQGILQRLRNR